MKLDLYLKREHQAEFGDDDSNFKACLPLHKNEKAGGETLISFTMAAADGKHLGEVTQHVMLPQKIGAERQL